MIGTGRDRELGAAMFPLHAKGTTILCVPLYCHAASHQRGQTYDPICLM